MRKSKRRAKPGAHARTRMPRSRGAPRARYSARHALNSREEHEAHAERQPRMHGAFRDVCFGGDSACVDVLGRVTAHRQVHEWAHAEHATDSKIGPTHQTRELKAAPSDALRAIAHGA